MEKKELLISLKNELQQLNEKLNKLTNIEHGEEEGYIAKLETNTSRIKYINATDEETRVIKSIEDTRDVISNIYEIIKKIEQ